MSNSTLNTSTQPTMISVQVYPGFETVVGWNDNGMYFYFKPVQQQAEFTTTTTTVPDGATVEDDEIPEEHSVELDQMIEQAQQDQEAQEEFHEFVENNENEVREETNDINIAKEDLANSMEEGSKLFDEQLPLKKAVDKMETQRNANRKNGVKLSQQEQKASSDAYWAAFARMISVQRRYIDSVLPNIRENIKHVEEIDPEFDINEFVRELIPRIPGFANITCDYVKLINDVESKFKMNIARDDQMKQRAANMRHPQQTLADHVASYLSTASNNVVKDTAPGRWRRALVGGGNN